MRKINIKMKPFEHNTFIGYVCDVFPQYVRIQIPTSQLIQKFYFNGKMYQGGIVGAYVVIEGQNYGFLGRVFEQSLPQGERIEITENRINSDETLFHPILKVEIVACFDIYKPELITKTVSQYPTVGAKTYSCSNEQISAYIKKFGIKNYETSEPFGSIGKLTSNNAKCSVSINSLFGRHCAILGSTGGGKSWTVAKLLEMISDATQNKSILIDATGEYDINFDGMESLEIGTGKYVFNYKNLSIDELCFLLRPSSKTQLPKLMDAIRSLKMIEIDKDNNLKEYYQNPAIQNRNDLQFLVKSKKNKINFRRFYFKNVSNIENNYCNFNFTALPWQITQECVWDTDRNNPDSWGDKNDNDISNCVSLISRTNNLMSTPEYNKIFAFRKDQTYGFNDIKDCINSFLKGNKKILRLDFSKVSFEYQIREILLNVIGRFLLNEARNGQYKNNPIVVFIDEAHQFLNKSVSDEYFLDKSLDAFEQISKEGRKYGLFLCIATQMPRDIPLGTLSQIGTFLVHRLINELDKKTVENALSAANRNILSFLPMLGEGEAILLGVDLPLPIMLKIDPPKQKPNSITPKFVMV